MIRDRGLKVLPTLPVEPTFGDRTPQHLLQQIKELHAYIRRLNDYLGRQAETIQEMTALLDSE